MNKGFKAFLVATVCSAISYTVTRPLARAAGRAMIERIRASQETSGGTETDRNAPEPLVIYVADDGTSTRSSDETVEYEVEIDPDTGVEYVRPKKSAQRAERIRTISQGNAVDVRSHVAPTGKTVVEFTAKW